MKRQVKLEWYTGASALLATLLYQRLVADVAGLSSCSAGSVEVARLDGQPVCEDFSQLNGTLTLLSKPGSSTPLRLSKRLYAQNTIPTFANTTLHALNAAPDDLMGNAFLKLAAAEGRDVSYDEILNALPPILSGWGSKPTFGYAGQHTFTGSREASVDLVFDHKGDCGQWTGFPRPVTVINEPIDTGNVFEGLLGGELPILVWVFPIKPPDGKNETMNGNERPDVLAAAQVAQGCRWEMTVAPVADVQHNHEQPAFFRFVRICGKEMSGAPLYYDTNIYTPDYRPPAEAFYRTVFGQRTYWSDTWKTEGVLSLSLPNAGGSDGTMLRDQMLHSLLRDMITRVDTFFPRYGICGGAGGCAYGGAHISNGLLSRLARVDSSIELDDFTAGPHNNGFQEILTASLAGSLELGAFEYAKGVLENYLQYYVKERGTIAYRGLEMAQSYYRYTRDSATLLKHFDKIQGIVTMLSGRRSQALAQPPGPLRGLPIGHDEADLFVTWAEENASGNHTTELPFYSIAAEFWRGLVDLGSAWVEIANAADDVSESALENATVGAAGRAMLSQAPELLQDLRASMAATHALAAVEVNGSRCWPYVAGRTQCAELKQQSSNRDSEPWRTYAEMAWSGALLPDTLTDIISWNRGNAKSMKGGMMSGTGSDASGNNLMTFTGIGWGYGLLLADDIPTFLLQLFTAAAHANTRGTWTAPEEADIGGGAMPYASSSQMLMPVNLRWMLIWEHPHTNNTIWLGRATPRAWLSEGQTIGVTDAPCSVGRVSYVLHSEIDSASCVTANVSIALHPSVARIVGNGSSSSGGDGGVVLRLRTPEKRKIASVHAGDVALAPSRWNVTDETVTFAQREQVAQLTAAPLRVCYHGS